MTKHTIQKQGLGVAFFSLHSIKGMAFLMVVILITLLAATGYILEITAEKKRRARPQKNKFEPRRLDGYLCSIRDKKLNELLLAKHHEPIHPNLFWLLLIPACLFASPAVAQGTTSHTGGIFSNPIIILIFIGIMIAGLSKPRYQFTQPKAEKNEKQ